MNGFSLCAKEHVYVEDALQGLPDDQPVRDFIRLFAQPTHSGTIVILRSQLLKCVDAFHLGPDDPYKVVSCEQVSEDLLVRACCSQGHLSVLFMPLLYGCFITEYLHMGYYAASGDTVQLCVDDPRDPFLPEQTETLERFCHHALAANLSRHFCAFTHDAVHLYSIVLGPASPVERNAHAK